LEKEFSSARWWGFFA